MQTLENIYTFKTRNFSVRVDAMEEPFPDLSFDDTGTQEMIERGDWLCFSVRASVSFRNSKSRYANNKLEISSDYLGNCIYQNFRDFRDNIGSKHGSYFSDMIRESIREARKTLSEMPKLRK